MADNPRIDELRRRVQKDPASIAFAQLAEEYRRAGDFEEAANVCRAGLDRHPSYLSARVTLGRALIEMERYDDARTELEYVLRSAPENLAAIRGLAEIHQRRGDLNEALRQYQTALGIAKHDPDIEESVHDLSRQLGEAPAPAVVVPPPIPLDVPIAMTGPEEQAPAVVVPPPLPPQPEPATSPALEAAADEFTKALEALGALSFDPPPAAPQAEPPPVAAMPIEAPAVELEPPDPPLPEAAFPEAAFPEAVAPAAPPAPAVHAIDEEPAAIADVDTRPAAGVNPVADELEAWLDAIVLDRDERAAAPPDGRPAGPDLPLNARR